MQSSILLIYSAIELLQSNSWMPQNACRAPPRINNLVKHLLGTTLSQIIATEQHFCKAFPVEGEGESPLAEEAGHYCWRPPVFRAFWRPRKSEGGLGGGWRVGWPPVVATADVSGLSRLHKNDQAQTAVHDDGASLLTTT